MVAHFDAAHALFLITSVYDRRSVVELQALACSLRFLAPFKSLEKSWRLKELTVCVRMQHLYHKAPGELGIVIPELIIELPLLQLCL